MPYTLSLEYPNGTVKQHGFHLGTDLRLAKQIAEERFAATKARSVALIRHGEKPRYFDFRQEWSS
jgi:creatinine amidohydrolase/Fe(II)-dependent formamide hydrolase-like protein